MAFERDERPADHSGPPGKPSERRIVIGAQFRSRGFAFVFRCFGAIERQDRDGTDLGGADLRVGTFFGPCIRRGDGDTESAPCLQYINSCTPRKTIIVND